MLLLVIFSLVLRLIDGGSGSSDEEYGNEVATGSKRIQSGERLASAVSQQCHICGLCHENLGVHMSVHKHQKPFSCFQCDKQFAHARTLRRHQRIHSGEMPHNCSVCGKRFLRADMLRSHQRSHEEVKPFHCVECDKQFAFAKNLLLHQRTHTGEKPFNCSDCGMQFARVSNLRAHQSVHTDLKPFRCIVCGKQFARQDYLHKHQRTHTDKKPFECLNCGKSSVLADGLKDHQWKKHAGLVNSTDSPFFGYAENSAVEESRSLFRTVSANSAGSSFFIHLENLVVFNYPPSAQITLENIENLTVIENPSVLHPTPETSEDESSSVRKQITAETEDPFLLQSVVKNPVGGSSLSLMDDPIEPESPFLLSMENLIDNPFPSENPMEISLLCDMQEPVTFEDFFLFQDLMDNPSLVEAEEDSVLEKLMDSPPLIRASSHIVPEAHAYNAPFDQTQEHILTNVESSVHDIRLPSGDPGAVPGRTYSECPVCFERFSGRTALEDHMLNHSYLLFPLDWLSYLESGDNDDVAT